jgi:hypothetical protein
VVPGAEDVPLSPNGTSSPRAAEPAQPNPAGRPGASEVETARQPHLDFLFRSRAPRTGQPDSFDSLWPKRSTRQHEVPGEADEVSSPATQAPTAAETLPGEEQRMAPEVAAPVADEPPSVAILKSGVVDGMAYTLYADGSIEAQLPQGTVRFASITELRAHIENHS